MSIFKLFRKKERLIEPWNKYYREDELKKKIPNVSMYEAVRQSSIKYPSNVAYQYFNKKVTYKKFIKQIDRASVSFKEMGIKKGDVVTLCMPNIPEVLICLYALNKIGAIANMLHPLSSEVEIKESLISTNSVCLVLIDLMYSKIESFIDGIEVKDVILVSASNSMNLIMKIGYKFTQFKNKRIKKSMKVISYGKFIKKSSFKVAKTYINYGGDVAGVIIHSGGTSGTPKNVVIQNKSFAWGALQESISLVKLNSGDSCLAIMPNFHGFGLSVCMHTPLVLGCSTILIPTFDSKKFDILFNKYKPTCVLGVPTLFEALINCHNIENLDLSFLKYVVTGGDILPKTLEDKINEYLKLHGCKSKVVQGYGMSEALAAVTLAHDDVNKSGSVGIPLIGNHIKIINPSTRERVPYGEIGEIVINSKGLMMGYLNNEKETNEALQIHKDGYVWLHTGDLGYMDSDGFLFYKGRLKRMIISSGYNVYPSHIEEVIEAHPAVLQCSVVGVPHPYKQEVPKAFIVLKRGFHGIFVKAEIKEYCKKNLAKYMVPYEFVYRKNLPKTKLGKVDFKTLQNDVGEDDDE